MIKNRVRHNRVLLLGETLGTATVGIVYLASYLRRHGVEAFCQWNDDSRTPDTLKAHLVAMLEAVRPTLVGVSIKWFPHMARGLEICKLVKAHSPETQIVLGGNTASYYWREFIREPCVDYLIRGDGELPLLALCEGASDIPNLVEKTETGPESAPDFAYRETDATDDVYLSHLDEIFIDRSDIQRCNSFFIYSGKRCNKKCFYCGGAATAMHQTFGSARPFYRQSNLMRDDIRIAGAHSPRLMFDFDYEPTTKSQAEYLAEVFADDGLREIDAYFYFWKLPQIGTVDFLASRFHRVTINVDLASLSEKHRVRIGASTLGAKPQSTDTQILEIFEQSRRHPGLTLDVSVIAGMPLQEEQDLARSLEMVQRLMTYPALGEVQWGWLHAQPGSPILTRYKDFGLLASATTYSEFMKYSKLNLAQKEYPTWRTLKYPLFIYTDMKMSRLTFAAFQEISALTATRQIAQPAPSTRGAG